MDLKWAIWAKICTAILCQESIVKTSILSPKIGENRPKIAIVTLAPDDLKVMNGAKSVDSADSGSPCRKFARMKSGPV
jgi:hypothetical protein